MPLLDISDESAVTVDGIPIMLSSIRLILLRSGYIWVENEETGRTTGTWVRQGEGTQIDFFLEIDRSPGAQPVPTYFRADMRGPNGAREWVRRGSARHAELVYSLGWQEGDTKPGIVPVPEEPL